MLTCGLCMQLLWSPTAGPRQQGHGNGHRAGPQCLTTAQPEAQLGPSQCVVLTAWLQTTALPTVVLCQALVGMHSPARHSRLVTTCWALQVRPCMTALGTRHLCMQVYAHVVTCEAGEQQEGSSVQSSQLTGHYFGQSGCGSSLSTCSWSSLDPTCNPACCTAADQCHVSNDLVTDCSLPHKVC